MKNTFFFFFFFFNRQAQYCFLFFSFLLFVCFCFLVQWLLKIDFCNFKKITQNVNIFAVKPVKMVHFLWHFWKIWEIQFYTDMWTGHVNTMEECHIREISLYSMSLMTYIYRSCADAISPCYPSFLYVRYVWKPVYRYSVKSVDS